MAAASSTSALSPLWDSASRRERLSRYIGENCASLEMIGSTRIPACCEKRCFPTSAAL